MYNVCCYDIIHIIRVHVGSKEEMNRLEDRYIKQDYSPFSSECLQENCMPAPLEEDPPPPKKCRQGNKLLSSTCTFVHDNVLSCIYNMIHVHVYCHKFCNLFIQHSIKNNQEHDI